MSDRQALPGARRGDWIQTFTGRQFWPLDPRPEDVDIRDIAHALAHQCRYAGHCLRFYSVAEHSILLAQVVSPAAAFAALMHDAAEAYLVDLPRPIKRSMPDYVAAEERVLAAILRAVGLDFIPNEVHAADRRILSDEAAQNMAPAPAPWSTAAAAFGVRLLYLAPEAAEARFLRCFELLQPRARA
ncbi:MAG: phosphohydrolase [Rhodoblastus sp.]